MHCAFCIVWSLRDVFHFRNANNVSKFGSKTSQVRLSLAMTACMHTIYVHQTKPDFTGTVFLV
jgi:hypothetical protein